MSTDPDAGTSTMSYDADGNLTSTTDADQHTISYTYDALGNLTQTAAPLGRNTSSTFDGNGIVGPSDPVTKALSNCYLMGQLVNGTFQRVDDPPVRGATHGYRCDYAYIKPPA